MNDASRFSVFMVLAGISTISLNALAWQDAEPSESSTRISVEDSVTAGQHADEALRLREDGRLGDAVAVYQDVLDNHRGKLLHDYNQRYVGVRAWVERELRTDPALLQMYRNMTEPTAQRALAEARIANSPMVAMQEVIDRYSLTTAGLEATFELSVLLLERGTPMDATDLLEDAADHPDFATQMGRWHYLAGIAAAYGNDSSRAAMHQKALVSLQQEKSAGAIAALSNAIDRSLITKIAAEGDALPTVKVPETLDPPLWRLPIVDDPNNATAQELSQVQELALQRARFGGTASISSSENLFMTLPAMDDRLLYLNNNYSVVAVDRISQDEQWSFSVASDAAIRNIRRDIRSATSGLDTRGVCLQGDRLFAILGMTRMVNRWHGARDTGSTELVCLNRKNGESIWQISAGELDESLQGANFIGTPMLGPDRLYCLLRRNGSGHFESFLIGIDARTGNLLWKRYISGKPPSERGQVFPPPQATVHNDQIFVVDNIGAVASIDGRTGRVRWLNVMATDARSTQEKMQIAERIASISFEFPPAVVTAGLVANPYLYDSPVLIDPETGRTIKELDDKSWKHISLVQRWGDSLLTIGKSVAVYDGQTLEKRWEKPFNLSKRQIARPAVTANAVWVPAGEKVHVLNSDDGETLLIGDIETQGNLLVRGDHMVIAGPSHVHSHMAWPSAKSALLDQVRKSPGDPSRGLALARLAHAVKRHDAVLEGADYAIKALEQGGDDQDKQRQDVFNNVRQWINPQITKDLDVRRELFERLAQLASTPAQQATYLIELGLYQEETSQLDQAVRQYQTILDKPSLASQIYEADAINKRQASVEARQNLERLVRKDPALYEKFEADAMIALEELKADVATDADEFVSIARRYPFSKAAPLAYVAAADVKIAADDNSAIEDLKAAYRQMRVDAPLAGQIISKIVAYYEKTERPIQAGYWLNSLRKNHHEASLTRNGQVITVEDWLALINRDFEDHAGLPVFDLPFGAPYTVPGKLLTAIAQSRDQWPHEAMITATRTEIHYYSGDRLSEKWKKSLLDRNVILLSHTQEQVMLWYPTLAIVQVLDTSDGNDAIDNLNLGDVIVEIGKRTGIENRNDHVRVRNARIARLRVSVSMIYIAEPSGGIAAVDRQTGQIAWVKQCDVAMLDKIEVNEEFVVVGGASDENGRGSAGRFYVFDAETGESRGSIIEVDQGVPTWVGIGGANVFVAVRDQLMAYNSDGVIVWSMKIAPGFVHGNSIVRGDMLALIDATESFLPINPSSGKLLHNERLSVAGDTQRGAPIGVSVIGDENSTFVLSNNQLMRLSASGELLWRDGVNRAEPKDFRALFVTNTHEFVISEKTRENRPGVNQWNRNILPADASMHRYEIFAFDRDGRMVDPARELGPIPERLLERVTVGPDRQREMVESRPTLTLTQNLVIGTHSRTVIIPSATVAGD